MIQYTNQSIAEKVTNSGDGRFGEAEPVSTFGFSLFYKFFYSFFAFITAYEAIFQLTLP